MTNSRYHNVVEEVTRYVAQFPAETQIRLAVLRQIIFETIPDTEESFRYKMPAYKIGKHYFYFAGYKNHIGLYAIYGLPELEDEIAPYRAKNTKDSMHFDHDKPLPIELIKKILRSKLLK